MMDVIHSFYEEDAIPLYEEHMKMKSKVREAIWTHLYEKDYPYPYHDPNETPVIPPDALPDDMVDPSKLPTKPYLPPTDPSEFEEVLDAPMGG
jgi:hypothetical protein